MRLLDAWAVAELDGVLKEGGASLGDRVKVRIRGVGKSLAAVGGAVFERFTEQAQKVAEAEEVQLRRAQAKDQLAAASGSGSAAAGQSRSDSNIPFPGNEEDCHGKREQRQLQDSTRTEKDSNEEGDSLSVSGDTIALMVTALLGVGSFIIQAKVSKDADTTQRDIERAQEDNARAEGKTEKLLEHVQEQMRSFVMPFSMAHVRRRCIVHTRCSELTKTQAISRSPTSQRVLFLDMKYAPPPAGCGC
jgi:hypothetical protein